jgi:hypothetical protein
MRTVLLLLLHEIVVVVVLKLLLLLLLKTHRLRSLNLPEKPTIIFFFFLAFSEVTVAVEEADAEVDPTHTQSDEREGGLKKGAL